MNNSLENDNLKGIKLFNKSSNNIDLKEEVYVCKENIRKLYAEEDRSNVAISGDDVIKDSVIYLKYSKRIEPYLIIKAEDSKKKTAHRCSHRYKTTKLYD